MCKLSPKTASRIRGHLANATTSHRSAMEAWRGFLNHARSAGAELLKAKELCGTDQKWSKYRKKYFKASKETSCAYMRVAQFWNDPRIRTAREKGVMKESIAGFHEVLRQQEDQEVQLLPPDRELAIYELTDHLKMEFSRQLKKLKFDELETLRDLLFWEDEPWERARYKLRGLVRFVCGYPEYDELEGDKIDREYERTEREFVERTTKFVSIDSARGRELLRKRVAMDNFHNCLRSQLKPLTSSELTFLRRWLFREGGPWDEMVTAFRAARGESCELAREDCVEWNYEDGEQPFVLAIEECADDDYFSMDESEEQEERREEEEIEMADKVEFVGQ